LKKPVLIVNSYAGSLVIAATQEKHQIIASCEDAGYGLEVQRANFPKLDYRPTPDTWPTDDLTGVVVLAHPPCAAFSQQGYSSGVAGACHRGIDAPKFQETKRVVEYALGRHCDALAVESVPGALKQAFDVHAQLAGKHGYHVFWVRQNAVTFGVPQWRERVWALYVRQTLCNPTVDVSYQPTAVTSVRAILEATPGLGDAKLSQRLVELKKLLKAKANGCVAHDVSQLLTGKHGYGLVPAIVGHERNKDGLERLDVVKISKDFLHHSFVSTFARLLDPSQPANTLLAGTWLTVPPGRNLTYVEHSRIMGYPDGYVFPDLRKQREYLSRGVCPPVARWILRTLNQIVTGVKPARGQTVKLVVGSPLDLRPAKKGVIDG
jgi:site-specific DNA-cytosine methylase